MHTNEQFATEAELTARLDHLRQAPATGSPVAYIIRRPVTDQRELLETAELTPAAGMVGDRWAKTCSHKLPDGAVNPDTQITLMSTRMLELLTDDRARWPLAGDNLLLDLDLSDTNLPVGQRVRIGTAVLEITERPHTGCAKFSRRFGPDALKFVNSPEGKALRLRGVHAQVVTAGRIKVGEAITKL